MNTTWKAVLGVILIFVFGWVSGAMCASIYLHHRMITTLQRGPEGLADAMERPLSRNLQLDDDQKGKFHDALVKYFKQRWELQKQLQPQVVTLNQQTIQEVDAFLKPEQQQRLQANIAWLRKRTGRNTFVGSGDESPAPATNSTIGAPPH